MLFFIAGLVCMLVLTTSILALVLFNVMSKQATMPEPAPTSALVRVPERAEPAAEVANASSVSIPVRDVDPTISTQEAATETPTSQPALPTGADAAQNPIDAYVAEALEIVDEAISESKYAAEPEPSSASLGTPTDGNARYVGNTPNASGGQVPAAVAGEGPKWKYKPMQVNKSARVGEPFKYFTEWNYPEEMFSRGILQFEFVSAPDWLEVNRTSGQISGTPGVDDAGTVEVVVRMSDGTHRPDDVSMMIQVLPTR